MRMEIQQYPAAQTVSTRSMIFTNEVLVGFLYGAVLGVLAFLAAGMGHGAYFLAGLVSAPISAIGIPVAFYGAPVLWTCVGLLLRNSTTTLARSLLFCVMAAHYISAIILLTGDRYGDWSQFVKSFSIALNAVVIVGGLLLYIVGQVVMWTVFYKSRLRTTVRNK